MSSFPETQERDLRFLSGQEMPSPGGKLGAGKGKSKAKQTERQRWKWWRYNEMFALLDVWSLPNIQEELDGTKRNTHVYNKMSELLVKRGTKRTPNQVREKMKTLKRAYWTVASKPDRLLEGKKKTLFERMEIILSGRKRPATDEALAVPSPREESLCEYSEEKEADSPVGEDDKHALHLLLSMGDNPCQLLEEDGSVSPSEVLVNADEAREITIESPSPSLDIPRAEALQGRSKNPRFAEVLAERLVARFVEAQRDVEKEFLAVEEHRLNEELRLIEAQRLQDRDLLDKIVEMDERRRQDDREHELRLFAMLASCLNKNCGDNSSASSSSSSSALPFAGRMPPAHHINWEFAGTFRPTSAKPQGSPTRSKDSQN